MTTLQTIQRRPWVSEVSDERGMGHSIIVMLGGAFCFCADPGSGTRGFATWAEAERDTRVNCVYEEIKEDAA